MIFLHKDIIDQDFMLFVTLVAFSMGGLILGITFHEFSHAFMAERLGDKLPRSQGRVSLNPKAHLDPAGTLLMLFAGFGWGKPVQHNPYASRFSPKVTTLFVAGVGPISNFLLAFVLALPIKFGWVPYINPLSQLSAIGFNRELQSASDYAGMFLTGAVYFNVILGVFNLIPLPPLDGYNVALGLLPDDLSIGFQRLNRYGLGPLFLLLFAIPLLTSYNPLADIMGPPVIRLVRFFTGVG